MQNWAGYADDNSHHNLYQSVSGQWVQPLVNCPATGTAGVTFAVGLDGFTSGTEEQDGTMVTCNNGAATYFTWWEVFPNMNIVSNAVKPGDAITAQVNFNHATGEYGFEVTDSTTPGNNFSIQHICTPGTVCANSSAEWVTETTTGPGGVLCLANFGAWNLTGATVLSGAVAGNIARFPDDVITMVNALGHKLAKPGALVGGNAFTVHWRRCS